jgi:hypothetical protein
MKILLGDFSVHLHREGTFKVTDGNDSLHETDNYNGVGVVNFAKSKNPINLHALGLLLMGRLTDRLYVHKLTCT